MSDRKFYIGAQNDTLYIISGRAPALNNDYPVHDADRTCVAKVFDEAESKRLIAMSEKCAELTAQLEASRKEVVRLREELGNCASKLESQWHRDKDNVLPESYRDIYMRAFKLLASTTLDPVWEHNFMVRKMRELPIQATRCDVREERFFFEDDIKRLQQLPAGTQLVAIPELKEVK